MTNRIESLFHMKAVFITVMISFYLTSTLAGDDVKPFPTSPSVEYDQVKDLTTFSYGIKARNKRSRNLGIASNYDLKTSGSKAVFGVKARFTGKQVRNYNEIQTIFSWSFLGWKKVDSYEDLKEDTIIEEVNAPEYVFSWDRSRTVWLLAHNGRSPQEDKNTIRAKMSVAKVNGEKGKKYEDEKYYQDDVDILGYNSGPDGNYLKDDITYWTKERAYLEPIKLPNAMRVLQKDKVAIKLPTDTTLVIPSYIKKRLFNALKKFAENHTQ